VNDALHLVHLDHSGQYDDVVRADIHHEHGADRFYDHFSPHFDVDDFNHSNVDNRVNVNYDDGIRTRESLAGRRRFLEFGQIWGTLGSRHIRQSGGLPRFERT
jgi:hypothetical protein